MKTKNNYYADLFGAGVGGTVEDHRNLHIVYFNFGALPSLAIWQGQQKEYALKKHFFCSQARDKFAEHLKTRQNRYGLLKNRAQTNIVTNFPQ